VSDGHEGATPPTRRGARSHARQKRKIWLNTIIGFPINALSRIHAATRPVELADDAE
jgi:hypothetical protein